jgi:hypothetical protein
VTEAGHAAGCQAPVQVLQGKTVIETSSGAKLDALFQGIAMQINKARGYEPTLNVLGAPD